MEDVLVLCLKRIQTLLCLVLILVVMEDVLVLYYYGYKDKRKCSLNPCCDGRCSSTARKSLKVLLVLSLNPCCDGRCSSTYKSIWYLVFNL